MIKINLLSGNQLVSKTVWQPVRPVINRPGGVLPPWNPVVPKKLVQRFHEQREEEERIKATAHVLLPLINLVAPSSQQVDLYNPVNISALIGNYQEVSSLLIGSLRSDYAIVKCFQHLILSASITSSLATYAFFIKIYAIIKAISRENENGGAGNNNIKSIIINLDLEDYYYEGGKKFFPWEPSWELILRHTKVTHDDLTSTEDFSRLSYLFLRYQFNLFSWETANKLKQRLFYRNNNSQTYIDLKPEYRSYFPEDFFRSPGPFIEKQSNINRGAFFDAVSCHGDNWQYDVTKVKEYKGIVIKRIDPLAVDHPAEEIKTAEKIRRKLEASGRTNFKVQEFIGLVYDRDNFYLLSKKEEGAVDLSETGCTEEMEASFRWLKEYLGKDLKDVEKRNVLVRQKDDGTTKYILIDFESR